MGLRNRLVIPVLQQRDDPRRRMGGLLDVDPSIGTAGGGGGLNGI